MIEFTDRHDCAYAKLTLRVQIVAQIDILLDLWTSANLEIEVRNNIGELVCVYYKQSLLLPWTEKKKRRDKANAGSICRG